MTELEITSIETLVHFMWIMFPTVSLMCREVIVAANSIVLNVSTFYLPYALIITVFLQLFCCPVVVIVVAAEFVLVSLV